MERLLELLARLEQLTEIERAELDEILAELTGPITDELAADGSQEAIEALGRVADAVDLIRAEEVRRDEADAAQAAQTEELLARIRGSQDPDPEPDPAAEPEAEAEPEPVTEPEGEPEAEARVPVAAAAGRTPATVRRPAQTRPRQSDDPFAALGLVASANNGASMPAGQRVGDRRAFGGMLDEAIRRARSYHGASVEYTPVVSAQRDPAAYGEFFLGRDAEVNEQRISRAMAAIVAAGGLCLPLPAPALDLPTLGSTARPVRDRGMQRFGATRGGIRTLPSPTLADVTAADGVSVWTEAVDAAWTGTTPNDQTKPCAEVDCPVEEETVVQAIVTCLTYSNFRGRFNPEQIDAWMRLLGVVAAREAENQLITAIGAGSDAITGAAALSAFPDFVTYMRVLMARARSAFRLDEAMPFTILVPQWFVDYLVSDLVRRMPAHNTHAEDLGVNEANVLAILRSHGINLVPFMDGLTDQILTAQAAGAIADYPATVVSYIYPSGSWLFLDGGELNLGVVRDSTLNASNRVKFFAETFEGAHFRGPFSYKATLTLVDKGTASALTTFAG